jgi:beta-lactamase class D OXA-48
VELQPRPDWSAHFTAAGTQGSFLLYDLGRYNWQTNDQERAERRFTTASTFKIPHALIAPDTGVIADERQVLPWDQVQREEQNWNRDHNLRTAMRYSVVPVFQAIARRIGMERMQAYLTELGYGNGDLQGGIDQFWLDGSLQISPLEQIQFLVKLAGLALPVQERSQRILTDILLVEAGPG